MSRTEMMSNTMFKVKHLTHKVTIANSCDGQLLYCEHCDIVNITPEQEAGSRRQLGSMEKWVEYHEAHGGEITNCGGGTMEFYCNKCGGSY